MIDGVGRVLPAACELFKGGLDEAVVFVDQCLGELAERHNCDVAMSKRCFRKVSLVDGEYRISIRGNGCQSDVTVTLVNLGDLVVGIDSGGY